MAEATDLTFDEMIRARQVFLSHTDEYVTTEFDLRTILSELGQYPSDGELKYCVEAFDGKMGFNAFTTYLSFLKRRFKRPEPKDLDTLRAFVALGGGHDRRGDINAENLRNACRHFDLTIDIDAMIKEVDTDNSGKLEFEEFRSMWGQAAAAAARRDSVDSQDAGANAALAMLAAAHAVAIPLEATEEETEEDHIAALKQFLFPKARTVVSGDAARKGGKRQSTLNAPKAPLGMHSLEVKEGDGNATMAQSTVGANAASANNKHNDSDSEEAETPSYQRNQYRPPSPIILSMRHSGRGSKSGSSVVKARTMTPRGGVKGASMNSPRGGTATSSRTAVSPRRTTRK